MTAREVGPRAQYYIESLRDRIVPITLQRAMRAGLNFEGVCSIDTDHAVFFSAPDELFTILHNIAGQI